MSLPQLSFILGGLLIAVGLLGGGIEIRDLKVPPVGQVGRLLSFAAGVAFVALALFVGREKASGEPQEPRTLSQSENQGLHSQEARRKTFAQPEYQGLRLDACYEWATRCGQEPATAWCKTQGLDSAVDFKVENVGERGIHTKLIGSQQECGETYCASYTYITCEGRPRQ